MRSTERNRGILGIERLAALLSCAVLVFAAPACATEQAGSAPATSSRTTSSAAPTGDNAVYTLPGTLAYDFTELQKSQQGALGLAIMPLGSKDILQLGNWTTGPAWSTIKVPLAIAVERKTPGKQTYAMTSAVTASDNSAAETLWAALGTPAEAASAVENVLKEAGDSTTEVPETRARAEYSSFGQAEWSLVDQVRFAAALPCLPGSEPVVELMGRIIPNHRWGLGSSFADADYKGGWGPDPSGKYLVRQFGLIPADSGLLAVAVAAQPDSGTFADGMTMLDETAAVLARYVGTLKGGNCAP